MKFHHCPDCGSKLTEKEIGDEGLVPYCTACSRPWFSFSYPCVICLVIDENEQVALIQQSYASDRFVCVAGYVKQGETVEHTVKREVEEEIGLQVTELAYIASYPYEKHDNLMLGFACHTKRAEFSLSSEVSRARWFTMAEAEQMLRQSAIARRLLLDYLDTCH